MSTATELRRPLLSSQEVSPASASGTGAQNEETSSPRTAVNRVTNSFRERNTLRSLIAISVNYAVMAVCALLAEVAPRKLPAAGAWAVFLFALLIIASRLRAFENLVHEASHHNLFPLTNRHYILEPLYSYLVFRDVAEYRTTHLMHHKHLGDPERDPDVQRLVELGLENLPNRPFRLLLGLPASGYLIYEYLITIFVPFWTSPRNRVTKTAYWASIVSTFILTDSLPLLLHYFVVPLMTILPVIRFWAEIAEHAGLDMSGLLGSSRSNNGNMHRWFMHPHNDGFHAVHHLDPQVPFHALPIVHEQLMASMETYRRKTIISHGFWETMRQVCARKTVFKKPGDLINL